MNLDWERMFQRYVFDSETTPYGTPVNRLTQTQAKNEVFAYTLFLIVLFATFGVAALSGKLPHGNFIGVPLYAFVLAWAAGVFAWTKALPSAALTATAPVAGLLYCAVFGFPEKLGVMDKSLIVIVLLLLLAYCWRIVRIAAAYPAMPPGKPRRGFRRDPFFQDDNDREPR